MTFRQPAAEGLLRTLSLALPALMWAVAALLVVLPFAVAADFGGVLRWTQYVAAIAIVVVATMALVEFARDRLVGGGVTTRLQSGSHDAGLLRAAHLGQFALLVPLAIWILYSWIQTVSLPPTLVSVFSSGSHAAYTQWGSPLLSPEEISEKFPISVSAHDSRHAVAWLAMLLPTCATASLVFQTRARMIFLLSGVALGGALVAGFGILRAAYPEARVFEFTTSAVGEPFATFVNRNNAALMLNLGLAASLGLLSWRLMALHGQQVDDAHFEMNDLIALVSERESAIGMIGAVLCSVGLLVSGSRGGLAAAVVGIVLALGWVRRRRGLVSIPVVGTAIALAALILIVPLQLDLESIKRMQIFVGDSQTLLNDGRFQHWPEGWDAAIAHLPAGSGLSTYGYAYLPYQNSGAAAWFEHADNLWLELFTEQGVFGLALIAGMFWLVARSLNRLADSPDALDAGIQTMGWYAIGAILFSQFLDFGLIVPANTLLVAIIASAIVSRDISVRTLTTTLESAQQQPLQVYSRSDKQRWMQRGGLITVPALALVTGLFALPRLHQDAVVESLVYAADTQIEGNRADVDALDRLARRLEDEADDDSPADLLNALASVHYHRARMSELTGAEPASMTEAGELYRATGPRLRRLVRRPNASPTPIDAELLARVRDRFPPSGDYYRKARDYYRRALVSRPLDFNARFGQAYLDFVDLDMRRSLELLTQLSRLLNNNDGLLLSIGSYAAEGGHSELAAELWLETAGRNVNLVDDVLDLAAAHPAITLGAVIPDQPKAKRIAAAKILHQDDRSSWNLLPGLLERIGCDQCDTIQEKASCHALGGDVAFALEQYDFAFEHYTTSIKLAPADANLRLKVIRRLREAGRRRDALLEARIARRQIPDDIRFDELIRAMAQSDVRELEQGFVRPSP